MVSEKNRHLYDLDQRNDIEITARKKWVISSLPFTRNDYIRGEF
jgi:hypothetical protein